MLRFGVLLQNSQGFEANLGAFRGRRDEIGRPEAATVRVPERFVDETLWPRYERASAELRRYLDEVASSMIERALDAKGDEVEEREQTQQALP